MQIHGSCHCGAVSFSAEIGPARVMVCHCSDCQVLSGAPFRAVAVAAIQSLQVSGQSSRTSRLQRAATAVRRSSAPSVRPRFGPPRPRTLLQSSSDWAACTSVLSFVQLYRSGSTPPCPGSRAFRPFQVRRVSRGSCPPCQEPVQPNPSLKLTRYGMRCKPGSRYPVHFREPGLQRMPPRAA